MAETIILDPSGVASSRTQIDITPWVSSDGIDWGEAQIEQYLADGVYGADPVDYRIPSRQVTIPLKLAARGTVTFDQIRRQLQSKASRFQQQGGWISRVTSAGTLYADVVNATLKLGGGWGQANKGYDVDASLQLDCKPDFYGPEIQLDDITETTNPEIIRVLQLSGSNATIKGDFPARVRIVVDEDDAEIQRGLFWGLRSLNYSSASTAALAYQAETLTPLDAAGTATISGASGSGSNVIRHSSLVAEWTPVLSTQILSGGAHMTHRGSYRVWARVYSTSATPPSVRLVWDVGDLTFPTVNSSWSIPAASEFFVADLGRVRLDPAPAGSHRWMGAIQALATAAGDNVSIDRIWFQPLDESAGTLRESPSYIRGLASFSARDEFNQSAGALTGKTAAVGGNWAGAGDATDFAVETTGKTAERTATSDSGGSPVGTGRWVRVGSSMTNVQVQVDLKRDVAVPASGLVIHGVFARYVDTSNFVMAYVYPGSGVSGGTTVSWVVNVSGTVAAGDTDFVEVSDRSASEWCTLRLSVDAAGRIAVWFGPKGRLSTLPLMTARHADAATGGALASGTCGFYDVHTGSGSITRNYDNFMAWATDTDAVLFPSRTGELSTVGMNRQDVAGAAYGPVGWVEGDLPRVPPSGIENRPVELFLKASRGDLGQLPDGGIDDISTRVTYRPCYLFLPDG